MDKASDPTERPRRRGIYLLPNLLTTGSLFAGFYGIIAAIDGHYGPAAIAIIIAGVLDGHDGRLARLTHTESEFGKQYDSLSDMVSFGLAPAVIVYQWGLVRMADYGWIWAKLGWLAAFVYAVAGALRLARFNVRARSTDRRFFEGLPSPSAAGLMMSMVWLGTELGWTGVYTLTQDDIDNPVASADSDVDNSASATGTDPEGNPVTSPQDPAQKSSTQLLTEKKLDDLNRPLSLK